MSKREYVEWLCRNALLEEYARPGSCRPALRPHLVARGWMEPDTWRLTAKGKEVIEMASPLDFPEEREPRHEYWNERLELGLAVGCGVVFVLFVFIVAMIP